MNCVELFAGCGGAAVGLRRAGFTSLACVEADPHACASLEAAGFPAVRAWIGLGAPDGLATWCPPDVAVDLLWGSPPCQPYSLAGDRQGADDARDGWPAMLDTIKVVRPTWVIVENVVGAPVEEWAQQVAALGYVVDYRTLDAADWGLPSHRRRVFLIAGPREYRWPLPTHHGPDTPFFARCGKRPWAGCLGSPEPLPTICGGAKGDTVGGAASRAKIHSLLGRKYLRWWETAHAVGFPEGYPIQGSVRSKMTQISNAVAPVMAEALARRILSLSH